MNGLSHQTRFTQTQNLRAYYLGRTEISWVTACEHASKNNSLPEDPFLEDWMRRSEASSRKPLFFFQLHLGRLEWGSAILRAETMLTTPPGGLEWGSAILRAETMLTTPPGGLEWGSAILRAETMLTTPPVRIGRRIA